MGGLVSRRKRSKVRSVSTQATECIPGRVLHEVTDPLEAQKLAVITEVTIGIGDGLRTSPVPPKEDGFMVTRHGSLLNKKRKGLSKALKVRSIKPGKKLNSHGVDFCTQYDFLALPGQVSPTCRRRSVDGSSTERKQSPCVIRTHRFQHSAKASTPGNDEIDSKQELVADRLKASAFLTAGTARVGGGIRSTGRAAAADAEEQADENCNILKEGTLLEELRNSEVYGACTDNEISAIVEQTRNETSSAQSLSQRFKEVTPTVINDSHKTDKEVRIYKQRTHLSEIAPEFRISLEEIMHANIPIHKEIREIAADTALLHLDAEDDQKAQSRIVAQNMYDSDEGASTSSQYKDSLKQLQATFTDLKKKAQQRQVDDEAQNEIEDRGLVEEDEEIVVDTLDWNADDRTRSPTDSRPNSIGSYADDADCTIDPMETTVNQRQTSLTTLKDGDSAEESLELVPVCLTPTQDDGECSHTVSNEEELLDIVAQYQKLAHTLSPVNECDETKSLSSTDYAIKGRNAPLVMPEETEVCLSTTSHKAPVSQSHNLQLRNVCIQKYCYDDANTCFSSAFAGPKYNSENLDSVSADNDEPLRVDKQRSQRVSTAEAAQQTSTTQLENGNIADADDESAKEDFSETAVNHFACQVHETAHKVLIKIKSKVTSGASPHKSILAMQETQAMTLLLFTGALPGETESEGAIRGAGDAQNLDATAGVDESQEANEREGIATMLRTQSKSSCQLEQLQAADHFESLSRHVEPQQMFPVHPIASDDSSTAGNPPLGCLQEEARHTSSDTSDFNTVSEVSTCGGAETGGISIYDTHVSISPQKTPVSENNSRSQNKVSGNKYGLSLLELEPIEEITGSQLQPVDACEDEDDKEGIKQLSATVLEEEMQAESFPSSTECIPSSTELTAGSLENITERSISSAYHESSLAAASSTSEEDWEVIPLRRVPAHTDLGSLNASASSPATSTEILQLSSQYTDCVPEYQKDQTEDASAIVVATFSCSPEQCTDQVATQSTQTFITFAEEDPASTQQEPGEDHEAEGNTIDLAETVSSMKEKINIGVEKPVVASREEGIGDLPSPKAAVAEPEVVAMEEASQHGNVNNSQSKPVSASTSSSGKNKKKKRGGKGKQK